MSDDFKPGTAILPPHLAKLREDNPIAEGLRRYLKDPENVKAFAEAGNSLAAGLQAVSRGQEAEGFGDGVMETTEPPTPPALPDIVFDDLVKLDLRLGRVKTAERVPKSDKLLKMDVYFGGAVGNRQIVAGVGKTFPPESLVGELLLFVVNLPPRKLMGIESHGMLFATGPGSEALSLLQPFGMKPVPGSKVG